MSKKSNYILASVAIPLVLLGINVLLLHSDTTLGYGRETNFLIASAVLLPVVLLVFALYAFVQKKKELVPAIATFSGSSVISILLQVHYVWGWWCPFITAAD